MPSNRYKREPFLCLPLVASVAFAACSPALPKAAESPAPASGATAEEASSDGAPPAPPDSAAIHDTDVSQQSTETGASPPTTNAAPSEASRDLIDMTLPSVFAEATELLRAKTWPKAARSLEAAIAVVKDAGRIDDWLVAHALLGRTRAALGQKKPATEAFDIVIKSYRGEESLATLGPMGEEREARTRLLIEAVSEAHFFFAEQRRLEMERSLRMPRYRGNRSRDDLNEFIRGPIAKWIAARSTAQDEAEKEYRKLVEVRPVPSPRWIVRAAERVGTMHAGFAKEITSLPTPKEWDGEGLIDNVPKAQLRNAYRETLAASQRPLLERARGAFRLCAERAKTFHLDIPEAAACEAWLAENPEEAKP